MKEESFNTDPLRFASLVAHQLQSPLNAVSVALQTVLAEYVGPLLAPQRSELEKASTRCDEAIATIRRVLAIVTADAMRAEPSKPACIASVLRHVHAQFQSDIAGHELMLQLDLEDEQLHVAMPEPALAETLVALLSNAIKYTPDHGHIRIRSGLAERPDYAFVTISDSGVGISEVDCAHLFEPFFRAGTARDSSRPGIGLGLAFVKSLVTAAGGTIRVRKAELGGAEFTMELPVAPEATSASEAARAPAFRVVIIGGVTAGPKAAARINRLMPDADITIVDRGTILSYAGCGLPYYVAGLVRDQKRLISSPAGIARDPVFFRRVMNVHIMNQTEALEIDPAARRVRVQNRNAGSEQWLPYDKLLLATGSSPIIPPPLRSPLRNVFTLHGVRDAEGIRHALSETLARDVVIVGGGLIGIEMTEALVRKGARVTIVERLPHILPMLDSEIATLVEQHLESHGVRIVTGAMAEGLEGDTFVTAVKTDKGTFPANLVILACGIRPNTELASAAGLALGTTGAILVNDAQQTSDPAIYAAGDCAEAHHLITGKPCYIPLGSTASKQGRVAGASLCGRTDHFPGVIGSCICKVFDFCVARTGLGAEEARTHGFDVETVLVPGLDRAHYMPVASLVLLKLIVDRASRRLLGAQATGTGAADKRMDVAAVCITAKMTVDDIAQTDLCYAPQYSTDMDNLITAANVARNKLEGMLQGISAAEVQAMVKRREDFVLLDVRTPEEYERIRLPNATPIPLGALRARMAELAHERPVIVYCDISLRAYEAALMLRHAGFTSVRVLEGGMAMWPYQKLE